MNLFISIITNVAFLSVFTLLVREFFKRGLQKQKGDLDKEIEKLKGELQLKFVSDQEKLNQKRVVYINLVDSMSVFLDNRVNHEKRTEYEESFLKSYDTVWLWGSDEVIKAFSSFLSAYRCQAPMDEIKMKFSKCVLEMRKDLGYTSEGLDESFYEFISFIKR
ncbi:hypothetical protein [Rossellomorea vietnamensis]|uniref:hypothetical protein n=1 Tax=Rossellomorea vietnamensis TaxID=218284 RepID=UPI000558A479|nr:hypothetical protein [Rossellomorea vietnamensis]